jgi:hypothetical protein
MNDDNVRQWINRVRSNERVLPPPGFPTLPDLGRSLHHIRLCAERRALWQRTWLYAGHTDQLPEPGSFFVWRHGSAPVLIRGATKSRLLQHLPASRRSVVRTPRASSAKCSSAGTTAGAMTVRAGPGVTDSRIGRRSTPTVEASHRYAASASEAGSYAKTQRRNPDEFRPGRALPASFAAERSAACRSPQVTCVAT